MKMMKVVLSGFRFNSNSGFAMEMFAEIASPSPDIFRPIFSSTIAILQVQAGLVTVPSHTGSIRTLHV